MFSSTPVANITKQHSNDYLSEKDKLALLMQLVERYRINTTMQPQL